jgi:hypothetical protein
MIYSVSFIFEESAHHRIRHDGVSQGANFAFWSWQALDQIIRILTTSIIKHNIAIVLSSYLLMLANHAEN